MSFGRFVCVYGIGYMVSLMVNACVLFTSLKRKYGAFGWVLLDDLDGCLSGGSNISVAVSLLSVVCCQVFWPVMMPLNLFATMRAIDEIAKKYNL